MQLNAHDKTNSPIFIAFTVSCIYVSCLFIDREKQETQNTLRTALKKAKEKELWIIVLCRVFVSLVTSSEEPASSTYSRTASIF